MWRSTTAVLAAGLLLLAGCGSAADDKAPATGNDGVTDDSAGPDPVPPSGLVFAAGSSDQGDLLAYDPATGRLTGAFDTPFTPHTLARAQFDPTMTALAYTTDCNLHVAVLTGNAYTPAAEWTPPQAYGKGKQCYEHPVYAAGKIRVHLTDGTPKGASRLMAVDPANPQVPAVDEGPGVPEKKDEYSVAGASDVTATVYAKYGTVTSVSIDGYRTGEQGTWNYTYQYKCLEPTGDASLICVHDRLEQPYGSVALVTVDASSRKVTLKKLVEATEATGSRVALPAPDSRQIAIRDRSGWYTAPVDGSSAPTPSPLTGQQALGEPLFWS